MQTPSANVRRLIADIENFDAAHLMRISWLCNDPIQTPAKRLSSRTKGVTSAPNRVISNSENPGSALSSTVLWHHLQHSAARLRSFVANRCLPLPLFATSENVMPLVKLTHDDLRVELVMSDRSRLRAPLRLGLVFNDWWTPVEGPGAQRLG